MSGEQRSPGSAPDCPGGQAPRLFRHPAPTAQRLDLTLEWGHLSEGPEDGVVAGPTWDDVRSILLRLGECETGFVVLSNGDDNFVQAAVRELGEPEAGLIVEYRESADGDQYDLAEDFIDASRAIELFATYFGRHALVDCGEWTPLDLD